MIKLVVFLFAIFNAVVGQGPWWGGLLAAELTALNDLKALFDSSDLTGWDGTDPCVEGEDYNNWGGVECDNETGTHVASITLGFAEMTGTVPDSIGNLVKLETLILSHNQLTTLPTTLGQLTELTTLYLQENSFTGSLPNDIGQLTKLERFLISENSFSGPIPTSIGNMTALKLFDATNNDLDGGIPVQIGQLQNLEKFYLGGNSLTGSIPGEFANAAKLKFIELQGNQLTGQIPDFTQAFKDNLGGFNAAENPLGCQYPEFLLNPGFIFNVTGINFLCPLPASAVSGQGVACVSTSLTDITPNEGFADDEPTITITGTGIQPNCNLSVLFGTSDEGVATPITVSETEITVKLPLNTPPSQGIIVPVSLSSNGKAIAGAPAFFNVFSRCPENDGGAECSDRGDCDISSGECSCIQVAPGPYYGDACENDCPLNCSGQGECYILNNVPACRCNEGRFGIDCDVALCAVPDCSGNGDCDLQTGECICDIGYNLPSCASKGACLENLPDDVTCNRELNSFGTCEWPDGLVNSDCVCDEGYFGANCDEQPEGEQTALFVILIIVAVVLLVIVCLVAWKCRFSGEDAGGE